MDYKWRRESPPRRMAPLPRRRSPERPWYKEVSNQDRADNHMGNLKRQRDQIKSNLKKIDREGRQDLKDVTIKSMESLKFCVKVFFSSPNLELVEDEFYDIRKSVERLEDLYNTVMNAELKEFRRLRDEVDKLDDELKSGNRNYKQITIRIAEVLRKVDTIKTNDVEARAMAEQLRAKALHMGKQVQKLSSESEMMEAKEAFKTALNNFIRERLVAFFRNRPQLLEENVAKYLKITYDAEVAKHEKSKRPWKELKLGTCISKNIDGFLQKQMARQMTNRVFEEH